jgi:FKBP-type peptidyl-prolyl cis-trans isomerase FklB
MTTKLTTAAILLTVGIALSCGALAQQTPASSAHRKAEASKAGAAPALDTDKAKTSYAIGMNVGRSLKFNGVDVDTALVLRGLKDELSGNQTLLSDEEAKTMLVKLQQEMRAKREAEMKALADANKKEGDAFLAANKSKPGVVTLPSGLQYKVIKQGTGPKPVATDTVVCNYRGTLLNGKEFDSSYKRRQPATFPVSRVIKGWTEILQLMPVGSEYQVFIPAELAYGMQSPSAEIAPNSTLIFDIDLLSIQQKPADASKAPEPAHPAK